MKFLKLILVTHKDHASSNKYLDFVGTCIRSGVTSVQMREKNLPYDQLLEFGKSLKSFLELFSIPLIINDDVQLAHELKADGVHLGQSDGSVLEARRILGHNKIVGLSVNSLAQLGSSNRLPLDYIGIGPIFPTKNKADSEIGCERLTQMAFATHHPIAAIGGIDETNVTDVMSSGAYGIAAIGAFHDAKDPSLTTRNLWDSINGYSL